MVGVQWRGHGREDPATRFLGMNQLPDGWTEPEGGLMVTALEGPGSGHQGQHQPDPVGGLCIEPELIKHPPPVPRCLLLCLSFHRGCPPPAVADGLGLRPRAPGSWGRHLGLCPSSFWVSGSGLVLIPKWTEVGQRMGVLQAKGPRGESGRWAVVHLSPGLLAGSAAKGQGPAFLATGHCSGSWGIGRGLAHRIESHSRPGEWLS